MRICRFQIPGENVIRIGVVADDGIRDVSAIADELPAMRWPLPPGDAFIAQLPRLRPRLEALAATARSIARDQVQLRCPVANPGKFVCGAGNFPEVLAAGS